MSSTAANTHSCFFPAASTASNAQKRPLSVRVDLQQPALVQQLLSRDDSNVALIAAVRVTWALLLRTYTGLERVCYSYEDAGGASSSSAAEPNAPNGTSEHVVMLDIDDDMSLQQLLDNVANTYPVVESKCEYNTSVLLRFGAQMGKTPAPGKAMAMPDSVRTSLLSKQDSANASQCNLRLLVKVLKSGISFFLEYRTSFIPTEQARNIASTVDAVLTSVLSSPNQVSHFELHYTSVSS
jgi:hypothetical protein